MSEVEYRQSRFAVPTGATDVLLIRHGESAPARPDRPFPLVDGQGDPELAPQGREHAERVAQRLADAGLDAIYVTTLIRTVQTAAPLAARTGLTPQVEPDLREVHLGEWEGGLFRQKTAENDPVIQRMHAEQRWDVIPGAESGAALSARVRGAIERLAAAHPDQRIAVFTHGGVIGQALALATGSRPLAFLGADNGSISRIVVTADRWIVRSFNDSAHLDSDLSAQAAALS
ncbi:histidine phosphatase family protein [Saccharopolyspora sp. WRP15-2]|uniref:Histidine phosphatase family protein n=1 Tax=Saccharopolyspora oryzae TaxID=2997343 RepID=A0ABT4V7T7_9PSEU|nr:histidine phosphatase family protein [Saccharopolyspora oryzae]MDA3629476.1 histidine phosphatase family protein [Saccharopolyspora oryzae]